MRTAGCRVLACGCGRRRGAGWTRGAGGVRTTGVWGHRVGVTGAGGRCRCVRPGFGVCRVRSGPVRTRADCAGSGVAGVGAFGSSGASGALTPGVRPSAGGESAVITVVQPVTPSSTRRSTVRERGDTGPLCCTTDFRRAGPRGPSPQGGTGRRRLTSRCATVAGCVAMAVRRFAGAAGVGSAGCGPGGNGQDRIVRPRRHRPPASAGRIRTLGRRALYRRYGRSFPYARDRKAILWPNCAWDHC